MSTNGYADGDPSAPYICGDVDDAELWLDDYVSKHESASPRHRDAAMVQPPALVQQCAPHPVQPLQPLQPCIVQTAAMDVQMSCVQTRPHPFPSGAEQAAPPKRQRCA